MTIQIASKAIAQLQDLSVTAQRIIAQYPNLDHWIQANQDGKSFYLFSDEVDFINRLLETLYTSSTIWFPQCDFCATPEKVFDFDGDTIDFLFEKKATDDDQAQKKILRDNDLVTSSGIETIRQWLQTNHYFQCDFLRYASVLDIKCLSDVATHTVDFKSEFLEWIKANTNSAQELLCNVNLITKGQTMAQADTAAAQLNTVVEVKKIVTRELENHLTCPVLSNPPDEKTLVSVVSSWLTSSYIIGFDSIAAGLALVLKSNTLGNDDENNASDSIHRLLKQIRRVLVQGKPIEAYPGQFGGVWDYIYESSEAYLILRYQNGCLFTHHWCEKTHSLT